MTIIATPGASDANSYCDVTFADAYFATRFNSTAWTNASVPNKETALIQATIMLDSMFDWIGDIFNINGQSSGQALRWPRYNAYDPDGRYLDTATVPKQVKQAQCEMAIFLIENPTYTGDIREVDRVRISSIYVDFDNAASNFPIATRVIELLNGYGSYKGRSKNAVANAGLVRS